MHFRSKLAASFAATLLMAATNASALSPMEKLGKKLYFDQNLSEPSGQACADCHLPSAGFADPDQDIPVSEGVIHGRFGGRNSPTASYAMFSPIFHFDGETFVGGQFLDGRATGEELGDPLADQALAPFLNAVEMNNPNKKTVVRDALRSDYRDLFISQCGYVDLNYSPEVIAAYDCIARAIGVFERTTIFARFNSKYDRYLKNCINRGNKSNAALDKCAKGIGAKAKAAGNEVLTNKEWKGLRLFMKPNNNDGMFESGEGGACVECHVADWTNAFSYDNPVISPNWAPAGKVPPLFTDFTYDNLGIPKSDHPIIADNPVDLGLGGFLDLRSQDGLFKVSTIRNLGTTAPYGHNGFFDTLKSITHFYNTRDVSPEWDSPEVPENVNESELGDLGLSNKQENQIVAFMLTLTDAAVNDDDDDHDDDDHDDDDHDDDDGHDVDDD